MNALAWVAILSRTLEVAVTASTSERSCLPSSVQSLWLCSLASNLLGSSSLTIDLFSTTARATLLLNILTAEFRSLSTGDYLRLPPPGPTI